MMEINNDNLQISIPNKRYFTIGEVSKLCDIKAHVLRYWEQEFKQLDPIKRKGIRRYYQQKDLVVISTIKDLLQNHGYTTEGAKHKLNETSPKDNLPISKQVIGQIKSDLERIITILKR